MCTLKSISLNYNEDQLGNPYFYVSFVSNNLFLLGSYLCLGGLYAPLLQLGSMRNIIYQTSLLNPWSKPSALFPPWTVPGMLPETINLDLCWPHCTLNDVTRSASTPLWNQQIVPQSMRNYTLTNASQ